MLPQYRPSGFQILPPVVKNLLIINGLMFLISILVLQKFQIDLREILGLHFPESDQFKYYQLLSHLFMHGSFMHILLNMFSLWMFGSVLENTWGSARFLLYYMITGFGAALVHMGVTGYEIEVMRSAIEGYAQHPNPVDFSALISKYQSMLQTGGQEYLNNFLQAFQENPTDASMMSKSGDLLNQVFRLKVDIPIVGASGAVFGLLLAFGMLFPNTTLIFIFLPVPIKAKYMVIIYGLIELWSGFSNIEGDNIAHFAHLGGMLFGFILIKLWNKHNRKHFY